MFSIVSSLFWPARMSRLLFSISIIHYSRIENFVRTTNTVATACNQNHLICFFEFLHTTNISVCFIKYTSKLSCRHAFLLLCTVLSPCMRCGHEILILFDLPIVIKLSLLVFTLIFILGAFASRVRSTCFVVTAYSYFKPSAI